MGISFYIGIHNKAEDWFQPRHRCDCSQRYCDAWDAAYEADEPSPSTVDFTCDDCTDTSVNCNNANARDLMSWLNLPVDYSGHIEAPELAARCRRRLWDESRNHDAGMTSDERAERVGLPNTSRCIMGGRAPDYLRDRTAQLLRVCEKAGGDFIVWA
jgi:hypothetical protein